MPPPTTPDLRLFFGHFHPLLMHLPIGLLFLLGIVEVAARTRRFRRAARMRGLILPVTAAAAVMTAVCGWLLAPGGGYDPQLLFWHRWSGAALAALCVAAAVAHARHKPRAYFAAVVLTLLVLTPAAHFGGSMTHGKNYLTEYAPGPIRALLGDRRSGQVVTVIDRPRVSDPAQAHAFADVVAPILQQNCVSCHGADKSSGRLRVDSLDALRAGGGSGPAFVAGDGEHSAIVQRMLLPIDDARHMPPARKPQPGGDLVALIRWWIDAGAPAEQTVAELQPPAKVMAMLNASFGVAPPQAVAARPLDAIAPDVARLSSALGLVIEPEAKDQPWVSCNASLARSFGDAELAQLAPIGANIDALDLAGTNVTDAGLAALGRMPNLRRLRLERTGITDAGLRPLVALPQLEYLNLYGTAVSDAGLPTLRQLPALRHLYLWHTKVTPAASAALADAMVDKDHIDRWQREIADLQARIKGARVEVVGNPAPASAVVAAAAASQPSPAAPAASQPTVAAATAAAVAPVNTLCPVSGKPIDPTRFVDYEGKRIAFCCDKCPVIFRKSPASYVAGLNLPADSVAPAQPEK